MELRKRKSNNLNNDTSNLNETETSISQEQNSSEKPTKNNNKRKKKTDSEYEYSSTTESKTIQTSDSKTSSKKSKKKRSKKKLEIYNVDSDDDDSEEDILKKTSYDPIIQQKATIATPLRIMKRLKFKNTFNEVIDLIGDSDEEMKVITILDSDDDKEILVKNTDNQKDIKQQEKKQNDNKNNKYDDKKNENNKGNESTTILIDLSEEEEGEIHETNNNNINSTSVYKRNLRSSNTENKGSKLDFEKPNNSKKSDSFHKNHNKENDNINDSKDKKQKRPISSDDSSNLDNDTNNNINTRSSKRIKSNEEPKYSHNLRSSSRLDSNTIIKIGESNNMMVEISPPFQLKNNEPEKNVRSLRSRDIKIPTVNDDSKSNSDSESSRNETYNGDNSIINDLENMMMDDSPSGNIDNIEISSDDSDDDVLEIISFKKGTDEIEISDDDGNNHKHNRRKSSLRNKLPESSMKKSIESRSSRLRNKNKNRALALQRLKERKHGAYGNLNNNEDESENENSSTVRRYFPDNDDFVVSDSGNEEVYFLTTKWDVKQRKKLYKAFKRLYKFCIAILIHEEYVKKNINELKKAFQIINKRINNVCKKITPVPPWANKFQADIDSFPHFSVNSEYPKTKCDSCRKYITSSFAVSFSGRKYNKVSLKEIKDKPLKDKERVYVIDRVCLERVQIYHELYHFRYNTLKEIKLKMEQNGFRIEEYRKKKDEKKVENVFSELKLNCKELYVKLYEKLKNGEKYVPNTLDV